MKMKVSSICSAVLALVMMTACGKLDVVGKDSARAFGEMLEALPEVPEKIVIEEPVNPPVTEWVITAPDNSAQFTLTDDFFKASGRTIFMTFPSAPFVAAGFDREKNTLRSPNVWAYDNGTIITIGASFAQEAASNDQPINSPLAVYQRIVGTARSRIGYHAALDHYNIDLGNGNMFEWAKDMGTNDKDIVFVLNPAPFIEAGIDPNRIDGWVYTKVPSMDANGKAIEVDKILKAFDLK